MYALGIVKFNLGPTLDRYKPTYQLSDSNLRDEENNKGKEGGDRIVPY